MKEAFVSLAVAAAASACAVAVATSGAASPPIVAPTNARELVAVLAPRAGSHPAVHRTEPCAGASFVR